MTTTKITTDLTTSLAPVVVAAKPARQDRSRKTREMLLDAAENLLHKHPWEQVSIQQIIRQAGCSNGAVYGRFKSKDELLIALYERHDLKLRERFTRQESDRSKRRTESLEEFFDREIGQLIRHLRENRWLLRAVGLLSRVRPDVVTESMRQSRDQMFDQLAQRIVVLGNMNTDARTIRDAKLAVFFVSTIIRESILYQGPHAMTLELDDFELKTSLKRMAMGYMGLPAVVDKPGKGSPETSGQGKSTRKKR